jgi:hypothetical protein
MNTLNDLLHRLRTNLGWVAAQFWGTLLIVLAGVVWTRVPERHAWQVGLTFLLDARARSRNHARLFAK